MPLELSRRCEDLAQAEIRSMSIECEKRSGINLAQGVCDTEAPPSVLLGAEEAFRRGINSYTRFDGLAELRQAISNKLVRDNNLDADPETEIVVSAGATGAFYCACLALLNPGDEVILFEPFYGYHVNTLEAVEARAVIVPLSGPNWVFLMEDLERAVTPKTKGIMINTPANPCGKVFSKTELETISDFAQRHNLFVFTDEIYEYFTYDQRRHISPSNIPGMKERTIVISGFSKTFGITGWRIGYSVSSPKWAKMIGYMNDLVYVCAPAPLQYGVARGLESLPPTYFQTLSTEYQTKRDRFCSVLQEIGLRPSIPNGAYYVLADISNLPGKTGKEKTLWLLDRTGVAGVPGMAFFGSGRGERWIRFCFAKTDQDLDAAIERLSLLKSSSRAR